MVATCLYSSVENASPPSLSGAQLWWTPWPDAEMTTDPTRSEEREERGIPTSDPLSIADSDLLSPDHALSPYQAAPFVFKPYAFPSDFAPDAAAHSPRTHSSRLPSHIPTQSGGRSTFPASPHTYEASLDQPIDQPPPDRPSSLSRLEFGRPARPDNFLPTFLRESDLARLLRSRPRRSAIDLTGPHPTRPPPTPGTGIALDRRKRRYASEGGPTRTRSMPYDRPRSRSAGAPLHAEAEFHAPPASPQARAGRRASDPFARGSRGGDAAEPARPACASTPCTSASTPVSGDRGSLHPFHARDGGETARDAPDPLCAPSAPPAQLWLHPPGARGRELRESGDAEEPPADRRRRLSAGTSAIEFGTWASAAARAADARDARR